MSNTDTSTDAKYSTVRYYRERGYKVEQHGNALVMTRWVEDDNRIDFMTTTLSGCIDLDLSFPDTVHGRLAFQAVFATFTNG